MSISCQINQKHFSVQLLLSPSPSVHPTIHPSILVITPSCSQFTPTDNSELPATILGRSQPRLCSVPSPALPSQLCRIGRFCAAAGRKRHRHVEAAAHHRPLHLLHRPQWVAGRPPPALAPVPCRFRASTWCFDCLLFLFFPFVSAHMKIGCENTVVRMVSSGKFVSRVSFSYRLLDNQELQTIKLNNVEDFCFNNWSFQNWKHEVNKCGELNWYEKIFSKPVPCGEFGYKSLLLGIVSQISDMNGFIFIIPFDSLRPLLNKATWKCPFVWGGTISIFFPPVFYVVWIYMTTCFEEIFKENGAKLNVTSYLCYRWQMSRKAKN